MMGYRTDCYNCDSRISMSARYCPRCGVERWGDDERE